MNKGIKHFYTEPVSIEEYHQETDKPQIIEKNMQIELIPVEPINKSSKAIFNHFTKSNKPIDLMEIQNNFPEFINIIHESYYTNMSLYEKLSMDYRDGLSGSTDAWRDALYLTELMLKYEPTIASMEYIGDFNTHNLHYCIIRLNSIENKFILEDDTVRYLINRRNKAFEDANRPNDEEFDKLAKVWLQHVKNK